MWESATDLFRGACGLKAPWVLRCEESGPDHEVVSRSRLALPFVIVGRDQDQGPRLSGPKVSRRHAYLQIVGGRLRVVDLQSRTGVVWEAPAETPDGDRYLEVGQAVRIGPYRLSWSRGGHGEAISPAIIEASPMASSRSLALTPPRPVGALVMPIRIGGEESLWRIEDDLTLFGRSESCRMVLNDRGVSRIHAAVARTPLGVWIVDLGSRTGVMVSGVRVQWAWLEDGDTVRLGRFTFVFRYLSPPSGISRGEVPLAAGAAREAAGDVSDDSSRSQSSRSNGRELATRSAERPRNVVRVGADSNDVPIPATILEPSQTGGGIPLALWQRQMEMMESFHNDMIAMVQTFFALHREHYASIRDEMDRVEELTSELDSLRRKLSPEDSAAASQAADSPGSSPVRNALPRDRAPESRPPDESEPHPRPETSRGAPGESPPPPREGKAPVAASEMHGLITNRIAALQRERQSYWRRILNQINS